MLYLPIEIHEHILSMSTPNDSIAYLSICHMPDIGNRFDYVVKIQVKLFNRGVCLFRQAARCGYTEMVKHMMSYVDPHVDNYALRMAIQNGHIEIRDLLMPNINCPNNTIKSAVIRGDDCTVSEVLQQCGRCQRYINTIVKTAVSSGQLEIFNKYYADSACNTYKLIKKASKNGHDEILDAIIRYDNGIYVDIALEIEYLCTLGMYVSTTKILLDYMSTFVNNMKKKLSVSIQQAIYNHNPEHIDLLLSYGANPSDNPDNLANAIDNGNAHIVKLILDAGEIDPSGYLGGAITHGHTDIIKLLLSDNRVKCSDAELYAALDCNTSEVLSIILDNVPEVDISHVNYAYRNSSPDMVRIIIQDQRVTPEMLSNCIVSSIFNGNVKSLSEFINKFNESELHDVFIKSLVSGYNTDIIDLVSEHVKSLSFDLFKEGYYYLARSIEKAYFYDRSVQEDVEHYMICSGKYLDKVLANDIFKSNIDLNKLLTTAIINGLHDTVAMIIKLTEPTIEHANVAAKYNRKDMIDKLPITSIVAKTAAFYGNFDIVNDLLSHDMYTKQDYEYIIRHACEYGNIDIVKQLMQSVDPSHANNYCIRRAAFKGHTDIVKLLMTDPRVDMHADNDYAFRHACRLGHIDIVKLLICTSNTANEYALRYSIINGHTSIVRILMNILSEIDIDISSLLPTAAFHGYSNIVDTIVDHSRIHDRRHAAELALSRGFINTFDILKQRDPSIPRCICHPSTENRLDIVEPV